MAEETLTLLMRAHGAREVTRETSRVSRGVRDVGKSMKESGKQAGIFSRALTFLGTRLGMIIILGTILGVTLGPPLVVIIVLLTAAIVALGAVILPAFILGAAAMARFKKEADKAGTAAAVLKDRFGKFALEFRKATKPGTEVLFTRLAQVFRILTPLLKQMRVPLTMFAEAMGLAMVDAAKGVAKLGPELMDMLRAATPLMRTMGQSVGPFLGALIQIGMAGMPILNQLLKWLTQFAIWLGPAVADLIKFGQSAQAAKIVSDWMAIAAGVAKYLWGILVDLWTIFKQLGIDAWPFIKAIGGPTLEIAAKALSVIADNIKWLSPLIVTATAAWVGYYTAVKLAAFWSAVLKAIPLIGMLVALIPMVGGLGDAWAALNLIIEANPFVFWLTVITAAIVAVYLLYTKWKWFHDAVNNTWQWIKDNWPLLLAILTGPFGLAAKFIIDHIKQIKDAAKAVIGLPGKIFGKAGGLVGKLNPFGATGGTVSRAGNVVVGEQGPEVVNLRRGDAITPNHALGGGDIWVAATLVMPDGQVLAQQTLKASRQRKASR